MFQIFYYIHFISGYEWIQCLTLEVTSAKNGIIG